MDMTRRSFIGMGAATLATAGLAGCSSSAATPSASQAATTGSDGFDSVTSYHIYIGLIDKDANAQVLTAEQALGKIKAAVQSAGVSATVLPVWGGYQDGAGTYHTNDTILIIISSTLSSVDDLIASFRTAANSSSIYVEKYAAVGRLYT
ncbi:MAG: hypothetical protein WAY93_09445 [Atopobiaceae bacterium]